MSYYILHTEILLICYFYIFKSIFVNKEIVNLEWVMYESLTPATLSVL